MKKIEKKKWYQRIIARFRMTAFFEIVVILGAMVIADNIFGNGDRFINVCPHPFWIVILLVASLYGTGNALLATFLATVFLYADNLPKQSFDESIFDYQIRLTALPFMWFAASFVLGEIRHRVDEEMGDLTKKLNLANDENAVITRQYTQLREVKDTIETRLASMGRTTAHVYQTFKVLETLNPARILIELDSVVTNVLKPRKFSVFALGPGGFEAAICHGWNSGDKYKRRFLTDDPLYKEVYHKKRMLSIINRDDEKLLAREGIVVGPLIDQHTEEVFGMIKIEEMDFDLLNLSNLEAFRALCECVGIAYSQAKQHQKTKEDAIYSQDSFFFSRGLLDIAVGQWSYFSKKLSFPISMLRIRSNHGEGIQESIEAKEAFRRVTFTILSEDGLVFHAKAGGMNINVLLPGADGSEGREVLEKLLEGYLDAKELQGWTIEGSIVG